MKRWHHTIFMLIMLVLAGTSRASYVNSCLLKGVLQADPMIKIVSITSVNKGDNNLPKSEVEVNEFELEILITTRSHAIGMRADSGCTLKDNKPYLLSITAQNADELVNAKKGNLIEFIHIVEDNQGSSREDIYQHFKVRND